MPKGNTKLYILTGFLGSGKTTLLLELLKSLKGKKVGIIQNEFGKLSIDGDILRNDDIKMVEITKGSIFCSCLKLNFVKALAEMSSYDFDMLFVESSGLGDPSNVEEILSACELMSEKSYDFEGVICTVDALNFLNDLNDLETVERQLKHCNLALITKADLANDETIKKIEEEIRKINPVCKMSLSKMGKTNFDILDENLNSFKWAEGEDSTNTPETKPKTLFMLIEETDEKELTEFLKDIIPSSYRIKGFVKIKGKGLRQLDVVGERIEFKETSEERLSQIVIISRKGPAIIKDIFSAWDKNCTTEMKLKN